MSCQICCDNYNKGTRKQVSCMYCAFDACRTCCETYLLSESIPKCMRPECNKEWTRKFMREQFTNVFLTKKYKEHLEQILFDQERALLPATQPIVEQRIRKIELNKEIKDIDALIYSLETQKRDLLMEIRYGTTNTDNTDPGKRFVRQCPAEECRGFLSTQWKCGICNKWTCPECHELKGSDRDGPHTCNPNNVATAKLLAKDSKPCPKCQSLIFKISGCDQMWCTQCHVAFCWKTGSLQNHIHNPHYFEWQRNHNGGVVERTAGDVECGREINHNTMALIYEKSRKHSDLHKVNPNYTGWPGCGKRYLYSKNIITLGDMISNQLHNQLFELPRLQTDYTLINQELRIQYIQGQVTEAGFRCSIQRNDKQHRKRRETAQVLQLATTAFTDIVFRLMDDLDKSHQSKSKHHLEDHLAEVQELVKYCNSCFQDISFTYNSKQYMFTNVFEFIQVDLFNKRKEEADKQIENQKSKAGTTATTIIVEF
jgi:hypothetical protein